MMSRSWVYEFMIDYRIERSRWKLNESAGCIYLIFIRRDGIVIVHERMLQVSSELGFEKCWAADIS